MLLSIFSTGFTTHLAAPHKIYTKIYKEEFSSPVNPHTGDTDLHIQTYLKQTRHVIKLLKKGANPNMINYHGSTPLHHASITGHTKMFKVLLKYGANLYITAQDNKTPLHCAAMRTHTGTVIKKLIKRGAPINMIDNDHNTPLHYAARFHTPDITKLFITRGANINKTNKFKDSPLHYAYWHGHIDTMNLLIKHGSNPLIITKSPGFYKVSINKALEKAQIVWKHGASLCQWHTGTHDTKTSQIHETLSHSSNRHELVMPQTQINLSQSFYELPEEDREAITNHYGLMPGSMSDIACDFLEIRENIKKNLAVRFRDYFNCSPDTRAMRTIIARQVRNRGIIMLKARNLDQDTNRDQDKITRQDQNKATRQDTDQATRQIKTSDIGSLNKLPIDLLVYIAAFLCAPEAEETDTSLDTFKIKPDRFYYQALTNIKRE